MGKLLLTIFVAFFSLIIPAHGAKSKPKFVSASVGQVGKHFVTSREVQIGQVVEKMLYRGNDKSKSAKLISVRDKVFPREVSNYLLEYVVYLESKGFSAAKVDKVNMKKAMAKVHLGVYKSSQWSKLEVTSPELEEVLKRKLQAKRFIRFRVDSSSIPITDDEAKQYFEDNRVKFGEMPFDNFKENIKAFLARRQVDQRLKDWFEILQTKYKVRNFLTEP